MIVVLDFLEINLFSYLKIYIFKPGTQLSQIYDIVIFEIVNFEYKLSDLLLQKASNEVILLDYKLMTFHKLAELA